MSSVRGPLVPPLSTKTLPEYFKSEILQPHSQRPALIARKEQPRAHGGPPSAVLGVSAHLAWDFEEFNRHNNALARGLLGMGVRKGDRVGVIMGNTSSYAMLQWACASIGAILVTLNPAYRVQELVSTLRLVGVKHLFLVPRIRTSQYVRALAETFPEMRSMTPGDIQIADLPELRNLVVIDNLQESRADLDKLHIKCTVDWREVLIWREDAGEARVQEKVSQSLQNDDIINLQFTSGTTGNPKAVSLTHSNLLNNGISIGRCMAFSEHDTLFLGNLAAWTHGACVVYPSEIFDPSSIVDALGEEKCTALHGVPTHFLGVMAEVEKRRSSGDVLNLKNLRTGIAAGSPIPIDLMKNLISKLNLTDLTVAYGMTETSPVSFQTTVNDPIIKRVETVGKVQPHVRGKIIDTKGNVVPVGVPGELCVAGYLLQKGYWEDEEHTNVVMKKDEEGILWMHTGDEGIMDDEGYVRIVGRIKDIIIRGGENLFPVQIENALTAHRAIREAAVVAVPDHKYGEVVGAWIVREPRTNISRKEVRDLVWRRMNPQNAPGWVWFLDEDGNPEGLPKTASGKVMKHVLREWSKNLAVKRIGQVESSD